MIEEENKKVVRQYVEALNRFDIETLQNLFAADAVVHGVFGSFEISRVFPVWKELHAAFALNLQVEAMIAEGETVAVRYIERGRSVGSFRGSPVTGKSYELTAMEWFIVRDGKIQARWGARDSATQMRQMEIPLS